MSTQKQAVTKSDDKTLTEFQPFGSQDVIKLSVAMVRSLIAVPTKSKQLPTDRDCIRFIALCKARKLNPFEGDAYMIGYDSKDGAVFNLITAHQAFLKRAEVHPDFDGMKSGIIVERDGSLVDLEGDFHMQTDKVVGGWASVFFKTRKHPITRRVRLSRFQKPFGIWQEDPAGMICKCAEADALRSSFPTMLGGLYLREEVKEESPKMARPMFGGSQDPTPITVEDTDTPTPPEQMAPAEKIRMVCKAEGVEEVDMINFLKDAALAGDEVKNLDDLEFSACDAVLENIEKFISSIKGGKQ